MKVERRDFLFLRAGQPAVLSCEPLFMRFLDSQMDGTTRAAVREPGRRSAEGERGAADRHDAGSRATDLKQQLDEVLDAFRAAGGVVTLG